MAYKIVMMTKYDKVRPSYAFYTTKVTNPNQTVAYEEWATDSISELETKMAELAQEYGTKNIRPVEDLDYQINIVVEDATTP